MRVLMPVAFRAEHGGLHDHVIEVALGSPRYGISVTVACRPGAFADRLRGLGVPVLEVKLEDIEAAMIAADSAGPWDLIHAHPFAARAFGVAYARQRCLPLVVTIHGWYLDEVESWHTDADAIVAVTGAIADRLREIGVPSHRVHTIENRLKPLRGAAEPSPTAKGPLTLGVVSRLDRDFNVTMRILTEFMNCARTDDRHVWRIEVAGNGLEQNAIRAELGALALQPGSPSVSFWGWLDGSDLAALYRRSFATISPGRSAIDALASGKPSILTRQIGTYALTPVGDTAKLIHGSYGTSVSGQAFHEYCVMLADDEAARIRFAEYARTSVLLRFDPTNLEQRLLGLYHSVNAPGVTRVREIPNQSPPEPPAGDPQPRTPLLVESDNGRVSVRYAEPHEGVEFAFYVLRGTERLRVEWYSPNSSIILDAKEASEATAVRCFARTSEDEIHQWTVSV